MTTTITNRDEAASDPSRGTRVGPKAPVTGSHAVCASQHPLVTDTMLQVMRDGGNAIDAAIAGSVLQAVVQQEMTNHAGTVTCLFYEAATGVVHELNSTGRTVPDLAPHVRVPKGKGYYASFPGHPAPMSVLPGFMPGMKAMLEKFGTKPWDYLIGPAIEAARQGHVVTSFEHYVQAQSSGFFLYTESGRKHFTPTGHLPQVGDVWANPVLADTLSASAAEGPGYFITGAWAKRFVQRANELGWPIRPDHMAEWSPRWGTAMRWQHRGHEVAQLSPPERQAVYCSIVLGVLRHLDVASMGHFAESGIAAYYLAHALRLAHLDSGFINDPATFADPSGLLMSEDYHAQLADKLRLSVPKIDLTRHVELVHGQGALQAAGSGTKHPTGSCEISVVDPAGNWVQMMNTLQSGGIAGEVVDGIPMVGSHQSNSLTSIFANWLTGGGRMRSVLSNTIVLKDGQPILSLGSPGNVHCTVPQVLANVLEYELEPYEADDRPRMLPLSDNYVLTMESRVSPQFIRELAKLGVIVDPLPAYDYHMGTFPMSWRDDNGQLHGSIGPRREGLAAAY